MKPLALGFVVWLAISAPGLLARQTAGARGASPQVAIDPDDIGGVVTSAKGPEAGVWVIAETKELPTVFRRIVVTDDQGRYLIPDLPKAGYDVFVRGYGLVDSPRVKAAPGKPLNLRAVIASSPQAAAQVYPPNYWWSMLEVPAKSEFPGTGPNGNGIPPTMKSQSEWIQGLAGCFSCHQLGDKATREIPESLGRFESSVAAWDRRIQSGVNGPGMSAGLAKFGRQRILGALANWTDRIAAGEVPPVPPRPQGVERNLVVTLWDWSDQYSFNHDTVSTDKRNPTLNGYGEVYNVGRFRAPDFNILDPIRNSVVAIAAPVRDPDTPFTNSQVVKVPSPYWGEEIIWSGKASLHNPMMDQKGRVWITHAFRREDNPAFCKAGSNHPSAKLFPINRNRERELSYYDPKTKQFTLIDTCFGAQHLQFDDQDKVWVSTGGAGGIDNEYVGWVDTRVFDETHDAEKAQNWTAFVLDTNGNGRRDEYVEPDQPVDPTKDKRIRGGSYGIIPNPVDGSVWVAVPSMPGAIMRINPGSNPPATTLTEMYEPPYDNPTVPATGYYTRGIDVDRSTGLIWTALAGSGHVASFDRSKCKVLNGPTATGKHCPEGWKLYQVPGPKFKGVTDPITTNMLYYQWVDQFDVLGLGKNVPIATGTGTEALIVLLPDTGKFITLRVPYPMGFYHRGIDGRIDDPNAGWKGRGLWANFGQYTPWHYEGGKGTTSKAVHFQLRPDPLAK